MKIFSYFSLVLALFLPDLTAQNNKTTKSSTILTEKVNVFLGSSADHGQMSPSASSPFSMLSIGPRTNPFTHTGYEYYAKEFEGFVHTHMEGVGCTGSGGNILVKPILDGNEKTQLTKIRDTATPGYYGVTFTNGIQAEMTVAHNFGIHRYKFPRSNHGLYVDLAFAFVGRYVNEEHKQDKNTITGWVDTKTTCSQGIYRIYYCLEFSNSTEIRKAGDHQYIVAGDNASEMEVRVGFSSVNTEYAKSRIKPIEFAKVKEETGKAWEQLLNRITVQGEADRENLFYSLLYRGLQSPFVVSEDDGTYMAINGTVQQDKHTIYNGWAIWDNYREQLPMLSLAYPDKFGDIARSIANLYPYGKNNWATMHEPTPTVRTEHALVVLLDAHNKGYEVPLKQIEPYLIDEANKLDYGAPDKALESSYDNWAMAE
ncbi:MAG TPA: glycoside hydrolase domain-containing protein, partial [Bacteroidales bacterium]|nr:glycoside hydrolase domain-containing protein [Bacteroidales bacterium]